jgi:hypothetical protein
MQRSKDQPQAEPFQAGEAGTLPPQPIAIGCGGNFFGPISNGGSFENEIPAAG